MGDNLPFDQIESKLKLSATHKHRSGDKRGKTIYTKDLWMLNSPLSEDKPLEKHFYWLWNQLKGRRKYLLGLKKKYHIDIFAGYNSTSDIAGVEIPIESMKIYFELKIPFGLSIVVG